MSTTRALPFPRRWTMWGVELLGAGLAVLVHWPLPYCELRVGPAAVAAEVANASEAEGPSAMTAVQRALERRVTLRFNNRPLEQVVRELDRRLPIHVGMNRDALNVTAEVSEMFVTVDVRDISLAAALAVMLRPLDLTWREHNDSLIITSRDDSDDHEKTLYYDVTGLIHGDGASADFDSLSELITVFIAPTSWPAGTGPGPISSVVVGDLQLLSVPQTDAVHREIRLLLDALRQAKHSKQDGNDVTIDPAKDTHNPYLSPSGFLDRPVRLEIPDLPPDTVYTVRPFGEVLRLLAEAAGTNILIDDTGVAHGGIDAESPIRIRAMQGTLRECLNCICQARWTSAGPLVIDLISSKPPPLRWTVANEVVWVMRRESQDRTTATRLYDVWDIPTQPTKPVVTRTAGWTVDHRLPHERDRLALTISKTIAPESWEYGSGYLYRYEGPGICVLAVSHRWNVCQQIDSFLAALREARRSGSVEGN